VANAHLWDVQAFLLEAIARDALGDADAARHALERALDLAQPENLLFPFLLDPAPGLLERHRRLGTAHAILISEILNTLAGAASAGALSGTTAGAQTDRERGLPEPLSQSEIRVLRYLPTKLSAPEIANELYLSVNTVKTHMRHLYDKLGAHRRHEAVEQARALGLLAPSPRRR
jgi:LuxR family maltose regulon positive regulatory protein